MNMSSEVNSIPVLFKFFSEMMDQDMEEVLWTNVVDADQGRFKIDSLPFYAEGIATDDIIFAEYDSEEESMVFRDVIEASGNSIIWVVVIHEFPGIDKIQEIFASLGCFSEAISEHFFALEIKASDNYLRIKDQLNELKSMDMIDYVQPCISINHQY